MKLRDKLELESSETRAQLNRLAATDELTDDQRTEMRTLSAKLDDLECRRQARYPRRSPAAMAGDRATSSARHQAG